MSPKIKAKWIAGLEGDKFSQGKSKLISGGLRGELKFDPLGVLFEVLEEPRVYTAHHGWLYKTEELGGLGPKLRAVTGLLCNQPNINVDLDEIQKILNPYKDTHPRVKNLTGYQPISWIGDCGVMFKDIAKILRALPAWWDGLKIDRPALPPPVAATLAPPPQPKEPQPLKKILRSKHKTI